MRMNYVQYFKLEAFQGQEENLETHTHPNPEKKNTKKPGPGPRRQMRTLKLLSLFNLPWFVLVGLTTFKHLILAVLQSTDFIDKYKK